MPRRVWETQKHKIRPREPPEWARLVGKMVILGPKNLIFSKKIFWLKMMLGRFPKGLGPSETQNWAGGALKQAQFGQFCRQNDPFWDQKSHFSQKKICA